MFLYLLLFYLATNLVAAFVVPQSTSRRSMKLSATQWTLAGDYLVRCQRDDGKGTFDLLPLSQCTIEAAFDHSEGSRAWKALYHDNEQAVEPVGTLTALRADDGNVLVQSSCESTELIGVLSRILIQWMQPNDTMDLFPLDMAERVDMVDRDGTVLGTVPRSLVHQHNLLHRGIGIFVTQGGPIQRDPTATQPPLYCHQRTATKRIFPSLYDMFVGGVSGAGEDSLVTARRELKEELGLSEGDWTDRLLTVTVCTAYNRCVVDLFSYTIADNEKVQWQEEEVAWGALVPYAVVEAAADLSISRFAQKQEWPGQYPPIQSSRKGCAPDIPLDDSVRRWDSWDFVPDGLLVWEGWLQWLASAHT